MAEFIRIGPRRRYIIQSVLFAMICERFQGSGNLPLTIPLYGQRSSILVSRFTDIQGKTREAVPIGSTFGEAIKDGEMPNSIYNQLWFRKETTWEFLGCHYRIRYLSEDYL